MKKHLLICLLAVLNIAIAATTATAQDTFEYEGIIYEPIEEGSSYVKVVGLADGNTSTEITIPASLEYNGYKPVSAIADGAFKDNTTITSITLPTVYYNFTIGDNAFNGATSLRTVNNLYNVRSIGSNAFANIATDGTPLVVAFKDNTVPTIASDAFDGNNKVYFEYGSAVNWNNFTGILSYCDAYREQAFPGGTENEYKYVVGDFVYAINETSSGVEFYKWIGSSTATEINIPNTATINGVNYPVTEIWSGACPASVEKVTIPASVTKLEQTFSYYSNLSEVVFAEGSTLPTIGTNTFLNCSNLTSITIPSSVTKIEESAFSHAGLTSITIPSRVATIETHAFSYCQDLEEVIFSSPSSLTEIGEEVFYSSGLKSVEIPSSVTKIGLKAFSYCEHLKTLTFADNSRLTTICNTAFEHCDLSDEVVLPNSITTLEEAVFSNCNLTNGVQLPESLTKISSYLFGACKLTSFTIPASITEIGDGAFMNCENLSEVTFAEGSSLTSIGGWAFSETPLSSISIPASVTAIGDHAFNHCKELASVDIPEGITYIEQSCFNGCDALTSITIPANVTTIGGYAFNSCNNLSTVTFADGSNLNTICGNAFSDCKISEIELPASLHRIDDYAFDEQHNNGVTSFTVTSNAVNAPVLGTDGVFDTSIPLTLQFGSGIGSSCVVNYSTWSAYFSNVPTGISIDENMFDGHFVGKTYDGSYDIAFDLAEYSISNDYTLTLTNARASYCAGEDLPVTIFFNLIPKEGSTCPAVDNNELELSKTVNIYPLALTEDDIIKKLSQSIYTTKFYEAGDKTVTAKKEFYWDSERNRRNDEDVVLKTSSYYAYGVTLKLLTGVTLQGADSPDSVYFSFPYASFDSDQSGSRIITFSYDDVNFAPYGAYDISAIDGNTSIEIPGAIIGSAFPDERIDPTVFTTEYDGNNEMTFSNEDDVFNAGTGNSYTDDDGNTFTVIGASFWEKDSDDKLVASTTVGSGKYVKIKYNLKLAGASSNCIEGGEVLYSAQSGKITTSTTVILNNGGSNTFSIPGVETADISDFVLPDYVSRFDFTPSDKNFMLIINRTDNHSFQIQNTSGTIVINVVVRVSLSMLGNNAKYKLPAGIEYATELADDIANGVWVVKEGDDYYVKTSDMGTDGRDFSASNGLITGHTWDPIAGIFNKTTYETQTVYYIIGQSWWNLFSLSMTAATDNANAKLTYQLNDKDPVEMPTPYKYGDNATMSMTGSTDFTKDGIHSVKITIGGNGNIYSQNTVTVNIDNTKPNDPYITYEVDNVTKTVNGGTEENPTVIKAPINTVLIYEAKDKLIEGADSSGVQNIVKTVDGGSPIDLGYYVKTSPNSGKVLLQAKDRAGNVSDGVWFQLDFRYRYEVTFTNDIGVAPASQIVYEGDKVDASLIPAQTSSVDGQGFDGWFFKSGISNEWTEWKFDVNTVTGPTTIRGKWSNQVTIDKNGHGSDITPLSIEYNTSASAGLSNLRPTPTTTTDDYYATGLYFKVADNENLTKDAEEWWNPTTKITEPKTLYVQWKPYLYKVHTNTLDVQFTNDHGVRTHYFKAGETVTLEPAGVLDTIMSFTVSHTTATPDITATQSDDGNYSFVVPVLSKENAEYGYGEDIEVVAEVKERVTLRVSMAEEWEYGKTPSATVWVGSTNVACTYYYKDSEGNEYNTSQITTAVPGNYTIYLHYEPESGNQIGNATKNFKIVPATVVPVIHYVEGLVYDGQPHVLIQEGYTPSNLEFKVNDGEWSSALPQGVNNSDVLYYRAAAPDANHKAIGESVYSVSGGIIKKKLLTFKVTPANYVFKPIYKVPVDYAEWKAHINLVGVVGDDDVDFEFIETYGHLTFTNEEDVNSQYTPTISTYYYHLIGTQKDNYELASPSEMKVPVNVQPKYVIPTTEILSHISLDRYYDYAQGYLYPKSNDDEPVDLDGNAEFTYTNDAGESVNYTIDADYYFGDLDDNDVCLSGEGRKIYVYFPDDYASLPYKYADDFINDSENGIRVLTDARILKKPITATVTFKDGYVPSINYKGTPNLDDINANIESIELNDVCWWYDDVEEENVYDDVTAVSVATATFPTNVTSGSCNVTLTINLEGDQACEYAATATVSGNVNAVTKKVTLAPYLAFHADSKNDTYDATANSCVFTYGTNVNIKFKAADGYEVSNVKYNDGTDDHALGAQDADGYYTLTLPFANVTVTADYKKLITTADIAALIKTTKTYDGGTWANAKDGKYYNSNSTVCALNSTTELLFVNSHVTPNETVYFTVAAHYVNSSTGAQTANVVEADAILVELLKGNGVYTMDGNGNRTQLSNYEFVDAEGYRFVENTDDQFYITGTDVKIKHYIITPPDWTTLSTSISDNVWSLINSKQFDGNEYVTYSDQLDAIFDLSASYFFPLSTYENVELTYKGYYYDSDLGEKTSAVGGPYDMLVEYQLNATEYPNFALPEESSVIYTDFDGEITGYTKTLTAGPGAKIHLAELDNIASLSGSAAGGKISITKETSGTSTNYYLTTTADVAPSANATTLTITKGTGTSAVTVGTVSVTINDYAASIFDDDWHNTSYTIPRESLYKLYDDEALSTEWIIDSDGKYTFASADEGNNYVWFKQLDADGNILQISKQTVKVDKSAPTGLAITYGEGKSTTGAAAGAAVPTIEMASGTTLTFAATDALSGIASIKYGISGNMTIVSKNAESGAYTSTIPDDYFGETIAITAYDAAENSTTIYVKVLKTYTVTLPANMVPTESTITPKSGTTYEFVAGTPFTFKPASGYAVVGDATYTDDNNVSQTVSYDDDNKYYSLTVPAYAITVSADVRAIQTITTADIAALIETTKTYDGGYWANAKEGKYYNSYNTDDPALSGTTMLIYVNDKVTPNETVYFTVTAKYVNTNDANADPSNVGKANAIEVEVLGENAYSLDVVSGILSQLPNYTFAASGAYPFVSNTSKFYITTGKVTPHVLTLPDWSDIQTKVTTSKFFDNSSAATIAADNTIYLTGVGTESVPVTLTTADFATSATATVTDVGTDYGMRVTFKLGNDVTNYTFEKTVADNEGNTTTTYVKEITKFYSAADVSGEIKTAYFTASYTVVENETSPEVTKNFSTLADAIGYTYPVSDVNITLEDDYVVSETSLPFDKNVNFTLDLKTKGKTMTMPNNSTGLKFSITTGALTINGDNTKTNLIANFSVKGASLVINGGKYKGDGENNCIVAEGQGAVEITDGTFDGNGYDCAYFFEYGTKGTISGGTFTTTCNGNPSIICAVEISAPGLNGNSAVLISGGTFSVIGDCGGAAIINRYMYDVPRVLKDGYSYYDAGDNVIAEYYYNNLLSNKSTNEPYKSVSVKKLAPHTITLPNDKWTATDANDATNTSITKAIYGTTVTVTYSGSKTVKEVKVYPMPKSITINTPESTSLSAGEKLTLTATISPTTIAEEDEEVTWTSSDSGVATVTVTENGGEVMGVAPGTVTITATTTNGKTATITLTVQ